MSLSPLFWLFQGVPELLALTALAIVLGGKKLEWKSTLTIGLALAVLVFLVRLLPVTFGIHFVIFLVILAALLHMRLKIKFSRCLLISLVAGLMLAVSETICVSLLTLATGIPYQQASEDFILQFVFGWPHIILLFLLALALERWQKMRHLKKGEFRV